VASTVPSNPLPAAERIRSSTHTPLTAAGTEPTAIHHERLWLTVRARQCRQPVATVERLRRPS